MGKGWEYDTAQTNTGDLRHMMLNVENYAEKVAQNLILRWIFLSSLLCDSNYYIYRRRVKQTLGACGREALNIATAHSFTYYCSVCISLYFGSDVQLDCVFECKWLTLFIPCSFDVYEFI